MKENVIIVPSYFDSEKVLIEEQKIWSATEISATKIADLEYLAVYRTQDEKYSKNLQGSLYGLYKIIWLEKIKIQNHLNTGKYILFLEEIEEKFTKKSPRVYQNRDYMSIDEFRNLPNV